MKRIKISIMFLLSLSLGLVPTAELFGQQDPQYTHYMYNTLSINPAYAGQRETLSAVALHRTQWAGVEGGPQTQSFGIHSPLRSDRVALGLNVVRDAIGPLQESIVDLNFAYNIPLDYNNTTLSFGVKAGYHRINSDWSRGQFQKPDALFNENISRDALVVGSGLYLSNRNWYLGFSIPNFLETLHYDDNTESMASERMHYYMTGGYVFTLSSKVKLKPAFLVRTVPGAPTTADISANALFDDKLTLGMAYRLNNTISAMAGFQLTKDLYIGYGYDLTTSNLNNYDNGTHEIIFRFEKRKSGRMISPRFF